MFDNLDGLDGELKHIASLLDEVRGKLGDRFLRIELADHLAPKSTPFRVPTGLGEAIDKRIRRPDWTRCISCAPFATSTRTCRTIPTSSTPSPRRSSSSRNRWSRWRPKSAYRSGSADSHREALKVPTGVRPIGNRRPG